LIFLNLIAGFDLKSHFDDFVQTERRIVKKEEEKNAATVTAASQARDPIGEFMGEGNDKVSDNFCQTKSLKAERKFSVLCQDRSIMHGNVIAVRTINHKQS
jgi:hypothetical protein